MSSSPAIKPSYDEKQKAATLTQCVRCYLWFWMTDPQDYCIVCRWKA